MSSNGPAFTFASHGCHRPHDGPFDNNVSSGQLGRLSVLLTLGCAVRLGDTLGHRLGISTPPQLPQKRALTRLQQTEMVDEGMNGSTVMFRTDGILFLHPRPRDILTVILPSPDINLHNPDQVMISAPDVAMLGPEIHSFGEHLDTTREITKHHPGTLKALEATYELIQAYCNIAKQRQADHEEIFKGLAQSAERREIDGRVFARDASGEYTDLEQLGEHCGYWLVEAQTWDLLALLFKHRLSTGGRPIPDDKPAGPHTHCSDLKFRDRLMLSDPQFTELNIILSWLKRNAPEPGDLLDTRAAGWAYTKDSVKYLKLQRQTGGGYHQANLILGGDRALVTELDPDAVTRQGRSIAPEDMSFEDSFMKLIFEYLRRGDLAGAMAKCRDLNQYWRAQTLAGGLEAWDDEVDGPRPGMHGVAGNRRRELWKRVCYKWATEAPAWEGAVYGILSGDLDSVRNSVLYYPD